MVSGLRDLASVALRACKPQDRIFQAHHLQATLPSNLRRYGLEKHRIHTSAAVDSEYTKPMARPAFETSRVKLGKTRLGKGGTKGEFVTSLQE